MDQDSKKPASRSGGRKLLSKSKDESIEAFVKRANEALGETEEFKNQSGKGESTMSESENPYLEYTPEQLVEAFNKDVGKHSWVRARGVFHQNLREAFEQAALDLSDIRVAHGISLASRIRLEGNRVVRIDDGKPRGRGAVLSVKEILAAAESEQKTRNTASPQPTTGGPSSREDVDP